MTKKACIVFSTKKFDWNFSTKMDWEQKGYEIQEVTDVAQCDDDTEKISISNHKGAFPSIDKFKNIDEIELFGGAPVLDGNGLAIDTLYLSAQKKLASFKNAENARVKKIVIEGSLALPSFLHDLTKLPGETTIQFYDVAMNKDDESTPELEKMVGDDPKKWTSKELERFLKKQSW